MKMISTYCMIGIQSRTEMYTTFEFEWVGDLNDLDDYMEQCGASQGTPKWNFKHYVSIFPSSAPTTDIDKTLILVNNIVMDKFRSMFPDVYESRVIMYKEPDSKDTNVVGYQRYFYKVLRFH